MVQNTQRLEIPGVLFRVFRGFMALLRFRGRELRAGQNTESQRSHTGNRSKHKAHEGHKGDSHAGIPRFSEESRLPPGRDSSSSDSSERRAASSRLRPSPGHLTT